MIILFYDILTHGMWIIAVIKEGILVEERGTHHLIPRSELRVGEVTIDLGFALLGGAAYLIFLIVLTFNRIPHDDLKGARLAYNTPILIEY